MNILDFILEELGQQGTEHEQEEEEEEGHIEANIPKLLFEPSFRHYLLKPEIQQVLNTRRIQHPTEGTLFRQHVTA